MEKKEPIKESIIKPIDKELILRELTSDKFLRSTNKGGNELYTVTAQDSPNILKEIGRLREIAFRDAGGGTGKEVDLDEFDTMDNPYCQLIVWNPQLGEILGGYRYKFGYDTEIKADGQPNLSSSHLFRFSQTFIEKYLPNTLELGRSFVSLNYQSSKAGSKALFALDNLWDGIGSIVHRNKRVHYFFGKLTMYTTYNVLARNMLLYFMNKHFPDIDHLIEPIEPLHTGCDPEQMKSLFVGGSYREDYLILVKNIRSLGFNIPPLINSYMNLSPSMQVFGTAINYEFGGVEETGILIKVDEITEGKINRHFLSEEFTL